MNIKELKEKIENKEPINTSLIFYYLDTDFIALQYINEIANINKAEIEVIQELSDIGSNESFFSDSETDNLLVYFTDNLDTNADISKYNNLYIITKKISKEVRDKFKNIIIEIPKLEGWQIKDYAYSNLKGLDNKYIDSICDMCNNDICRIANEIERLNIFTESERNFMFNKFISDGIYNDLTNMTIFNITNSIIKKDIDGLKRAYKQIKNIDSSDMGFYILLYQAFKNVILVQLNIDATPESTGLKSGQFYAIKKNNINYYTKSQLMSIFEILTDIDRQVKTGSIDTSILIDYLIVKILTI